MMVSVLVFASTNQLNSQKEWEKIPHGLTIHLTSDVDTCLYSIGRIVLSIEFRNNRKFCMKLNKNIHVTTHDIRTHDHIKIDIRYHENLYEYAFLDGKEAMPQAYFLFNKKSLELKEVINFRSSVIKKEKGPIIKHGTTNIDNVNFGVYQIQAQYITHATDTIFSNLITVNYVNN